MYKHQVIEELRGIVSGYLESVGLELVDLIYRYEGRDLFLRILADKPLGGITLEECGRLNREIGGILDEKETLGDRYILEVSSPGLDRPLATKNDFLRCLNRRARFFLKDPVEGKIEWAGEILAVDDYSVQAGIDTGIIVIPLDKINKAKQIF
ncbi:MAG: ribosome maturation factor RimP [Candidatus Omnitrophica bacterium]|nr:ribosome maturation factor RimP [Candidatus Omnitrophota bacterium]